MKVTTGAADGPWAPRATARENMKYGADCIKICASGGVLSRGTRPGSPVLAQPGEMAELVLSWSLAG
jgi:imidazolonepropionase-like amidohydrolase